MEIDTGNNYDVGIVGFWYGQNYGSVLTYFALYRCVEQLGLRPLLVNKPLGLWDDGFYDKNTLANRFFNKRCKKSRIRRNYSDWIDLNNFCETFLVGSDIVWKYTLPKRVGYYFFLDFINADRRKVSYASSFGGEWGANHQVTRNVEFFLKKFDFVSVRENEAAEICKNTFHINATQVMDPVFLLDKEEYVELTKKSERTCDSDYIMSYILGPGESKKNLLLNLQKMVNAQLINVVGAANEQVGTSRLRLETKTNLSIEDWLKYILDCKLYIGDSFHGICFSIIFRKNFILVRNRVSPSRCRFDTLLKICGLESRSIYADEDITLREDLLDDIDYDEVYKKLAPRIDFSRKWLENALLSERPVKDPDTFDIINEKAASIMLENISLKKRLEELEEKVEALTAAKDK